jgi:hypothetical protein
MDGAAVAIAISHFIGDPRWAIVGVATFAAKKVRKLRHDNAPNPETPRNQPQLG